MEVEARGGNQDHRRLLRRTVTLRVVDAEAMDRAHRFAGGLGVLHRREAGWLARSLIDEIVVRGHVGIAVGGPAVPIHSAAGSHASGCSDALGSVLRGIEVAGIGVKDGFDSCVANVLHCVTRPLHVLVVVHTGAVHQIGVVPLFDALIDLFVHVICSEGVHQAFDALNGTVLVFQVLDGVVRALHLLQVLVPVAVIALWKRFARLDGPFMRFTGRLLELQLGSLASCDFFEVGNLKVDALELSDVDGDIL
mmetsp:Transcript_104868/g.249672  ORF Transcript_104868/g.249672 Transcript_104868/m.249672 type:complete len:251 (-) Transcript_104868:17-769(-)